MSLTTVVLSQLALPSFKLLLISGWRGSESVSVITGFFLLPLFFRRLHGINQATSPGPTASPGTETRSPKSHSLLWTGHWSSPLALDRSFCYKLWFMMPWWWVSYWLVYSDVVSPFVFQISLSPFCSTGENVFFSKLALVGWSRALFLFPWL